MKIAWRWLVCGWLIASCAAAGESTPSTTADDVAARYRDRVEFLFDQSYAAGDNPRQCVDLYLPKQRTHAGPLPVVAFVHGGGWRAGDRRRYLSQAAHLVSSGDYAAVAIGYRLTDEAQWPAQIHDCKAAIRWIRGHAAQYGLNVDKIGVTGESAGGHLATLLATSGSADALAGTLGPFANLSSQVACAVNICGPTDFSIRLYRGPANLPHDVVVDKLLGGSPQSKPEVAKEASPVTYVSRSTPPILTFHGRNDERVDFKHAELLDRAMRQAGAVSWLVPVENAGHAVPRTPELQQRTRDFWDKYLRGLDRVVSTEPIVAPPAEKKP